jgi:regulator of nucleoside diphosphate kinase
MPPRRSIIPENQIIIPRSDYDLLRAILHTLRKETGPHAPRLNALDAQLRRCFVVKPDAVPRNVVTMNSRVRVRDMRANKAQTYTLVYPRDANIDAGKLSVLAPLGTAILGGRTGDVIRWQVPAGIRTLKIERVLYEPQAMGERVA